MGFHCGTALSNTGFFNDSGLPESNELGKRHADHEEPLRLDA
jgi:hypothetical protein